VNFKIFSPPGQQQQEEAKTDTPSSNDSLWSEGDAASQSPPGSAPASPAPAASPAESAATTPASQSSATTATPAESGSTASSTGATSTSSEASTVTGEKVLQGYIRIVPSGTKVPIIMDSAIDSDTSQEGDEFAARTSEDLTIDGSTVVPAGSVIKGRIARLNSPKHLNRSGSVGLKFDTVTTPDNRQIPLSATLVARGGVVHARRGLKDIAIDTGTFVAPMALGAAIGAIAGGSSSGSSGVGMAGGLLIGTGIGVAIGTIILCAKKGKRVDVRPGDELKIELAEDLRMPM
jgi:hypothetical protein